MCRSLKAHITNARTESLKECFTLASISLKNRKQLNKCVSTVQLPFSSEKIYLKEKKICVNSSASFSNRGNLFKEKRKNSIFLVTAHFVLSIVTFEAYKRIQVITQSKVSRISNLGVFNCLITYFILEQTHSYLQEGNQGKIC